MNQQTAEFTCNIALDCKLLAEVFRSFKTTRVNLRRLELMESVRKDDNRFYLHLELEYSEDSPQQTAAIDQLRKTLQQDGQQ